MHRLTNLFYFFKKFFESFNKSSPECHKACKSTCFKDGPDGCVDCNEGWLFNEGKCEGKFQVKCLL